MSWARRHWVLTIIILVVLALIAIYLLLMVGSDSNEIQDGSPATGIS
jgi:hypothetical protein